VETEPEPTDRMNAVTEPHAESDPPTVDEADRAPTVDAFFSAIERRALRMAWLATGDRDLALDLVQDAMLAFFRHYAERPAAQRRALFFRVLHNRIVDHYRHRGRWSRWLLASGRGDDTLHDPVDTARDTAPGPDDIAAGDETGRAIEAALMALPLRQRQVFLLRLREELDVAETARTLGISAGSVKTHLHRALQALRESLEDTT
jgi:RNA polymerase sigma-70 factor (ECF subfamily)